MDTTILRSEETAADYSPPTDFNIARAFPVTDQLVRQVARRKLRLDARRFVTSLPVRCLAAGILGVVVGAGFARR